MADPFRTQPSRPLLHVTLFFASSFVTTTIYMSFFTTSIFNILCPVYSLSLLCTAQPCPSYSVSKLCFCVSLICSFLMLCRDLQTLVCSRSHRTVLQTLPFTLAISLLSQITTETHLQPVHLFISLVNCLLFSPSLLLLTLIHTRVSCLCYS